MKKLLLLSIFCVLVFDSCRDNSSTESLANLTIQGTWRKDKTIIKSGANNNVTLGTLSYDDCIKKSTYEFTEAGNLNYNFYDASGIVCQKYFTGTDPYSFDKSVMKLNINGTYAKVFSLTETDMVMEDLDTYDYDGDGIDDLMELYLKRQ